MSFGAGLLLVGLLKALAEIGGGAPGVIRAGEVPREDAKPVSFFQPGMPVVTFEELPPPQIMGGFGGEPTIIQIVRPPVEYKPIPTPTIIYEEPTFPVVVVTPQQIQRQVEVRKMEQAAVTKLAITEPALAKTLEQTFAAQAIQVPGWMPKGEV